MAVRQPGQPFDQGTLTWADGGNSVTKVGCGEGRIWHWLATDELPDETAEVHGELDWTAATC